MELMLKICAFCIFGTICVIVVREKQPSLALLLTILAVCALLGIVLGSVSSLFHKLRGIVSALDIDTQLFVPILKVLCVSLLSRITIEICRGGGERTLAVCVELAGTICAVICAIPLFELALGYLGGML